MGIVSSFVVALLLNRAWTTSSYGKVSLRMPAQPIADLSHLLATNVVNKMPDIKHGFESPYINCNALLLCIATQADFRNPPLDRGPVRTCTKWRRDVRCLQLPSGAP